MTGPLPCEARPGSLLLRLRVTPKARRAGIEGVVRDAEGRALLAVKVTAPPADGAANKAVVALIADLLGVPKSAVTIESGAGSRIKTLAIAGDGAALSGRLAEVAGG